MSFNRISGMKRLLAVAAIATSFPCIPAYAEPPKSSEFLTYSEGQRAWWLAGAFEAMSHAIYQIDPKKGDCIADWYFKGNGEKQRQKEIEETMQKYPDHAPSSVVLALVQKHCGKIKP